MTAVPQPQKARQETGGPAMRGERAVSGQPEASDIEARLTGLATLATSDLRREWQRLYRAAPPTRLSRDLLLRGIAYKLQERALGGLSLNTRRQLRSLAAASGQGSGACHAPAIRLRPGTKLVREWRQRVHTVSVLDHGFEYQGEHYNSLSRIARRITGVIWSGPRFFGIRKPQKRAERAPNE
jgi:Protein of unknown function (DUF2924)